MKNLPTLIQSAVPEDRDERTKGFVLSENRTKDMQLREREGGMEKRGDIGTVKAGVV